MSDKLFVSDWKYPLFAHAAFSSALNVLTLEHSKLSAQTLSEFGDLATLFTHMAYRIPYKRLNESGEESFVSEKAQFHHRLPVWELIVHVADEKLTWCRSPQNDVSKIGAELFHILASTAEDIKEGVVQKSWARVQLIEIISTVIPLLVAHLEKREADSG